MISELPPGSAFGSPSRKILYPTTSPSTDAFQLRIGRWFVIARSTRKIAGCAGARLSMMTPLRVELTVLLLPTLSYATRRKLQVAHSSPGTGTQAIDENGADGLVR